MDSLLNWFSGTPKYICFEDMLIATGKPGEYIIINTLPNSEQSCLIKGTCPIGDEEHTINKIISKYDGVEYKIIIYGKNACDLSVYKKRNQLLSLGFGHVYIYKGGLFEWLLLQDIYGESHFATCGKAHDILAYKGAQLFNL